MFNRKLIESLKKEKEDLQLKVDQRDKFLKDYQEENEILLQNAQEQRAKIEDLENNIEFLFNNLSKAKKELVRPTKQN